MFQSTLSTWQEAHRPIVLSSSIVIGVSVRTFGVVTLYVSRGSGQRLLSQLRTQPDMLSLSA